MPRVGKDEPGPAKHPDIPTTPVEETIEPIDPALQEFGLRAAAIIAEIVKADATMAASATTGAGREAAMINYDNDRELALRLLGFEEEGDGEEGEDE